MKTPVKIGIAVAILVILGFAYYALSPLFKKVTINDPAPIMGQDITTPELANPIEPFIIKESKIVATPLHPAEGTVKAIITDKGITVRYENYKTINGPDLYVYLAKDLDAKEFVSLGRIKGTAGNINYEIPPEVDFTKYKYVLTWCKAFGVLFNSAEIN